MANNRMFIYCKKDRALFSIAKWYPTGGWFTPRDDTESWNKFLDDHSHLDEEFGYKDEGSVFGMVYEYNKKFFYIDGNRVGFYPKDPSDMTDKEKDEYIEKYRKKYGQ